MLDQGTPKLQRGTISRRALLGAAAAIPLVAIRTRPARAAEFDYKLATGQSLTQPINARLDQAVKRIKEASGGKLDIKFFPASQLGSDTDLLTQIRSGGVDFLNIAGSVLSTVAPVTGIANVGFAFADYAQVWSAMDGDLGKLIATQIEKTGALVVAKPADNTFRQISSFSKPLKTPADLAGYRCSNRSAPIPPRSTSTSSTQRCRPIWSTGRRTALSPSRPARSTRCRNTSRKPIISGIRSSFSATAAQ